MWFFPSLKEKKFILSLFLTQIRLKGSTCRAVELNTITSEKRTKGERNPRSPSLQSLKKLPCAEIKDHIKRQESQETQDLMSFVTPIQLCKLWEDGIF